MKSSGDWLHWCRVWNNHCIVHMAHINIWKKLAALGRYHASYRSPDEATATTWDFAIGLLR